MGSWLFIEMLHDNSYCYIIVSRTNFLFIYVALLSIRAIPDILQISFLLWRCDWAFNISRLLWPGNCSIRYPNWPMWCVWSGQNEQSAIYASDSCKPVMTELFLSFFTLFWGTILQEAGYDERVMLIYDGLHYDALAVGVSLWITFFVVYLWYCWPF